MEKYILTFVRGSGSVWGHLSTIWRVQVWFRFTEVKFCWFRFGSGSPKWNGSFGFTVRVQVRFDTLLGINKHGRHNWHQRSQTLRINYEQLRLNIGEKIKTASLNSKFTDSYKKACLRYYKSRIQLRYCYLWLIYYTLYKGLKFCLIGFTVTSNQLMTAVSAVDQCQHAQENYCFCGSNMK